MRRGVGRALFLAAVAVLAVAGTALAIRVQAGNIVVVADGGFSPTALPRDVDAPITIHGHGWIGTVDGSFPPILKTIQLEFDKHGSVDTTGLPVCTSGRLQSTDVAAARRRCPGAIVGRGRGRAVVVFAEQKPIPISSPITLFNGPRVGGDPTLFAHAYTTVPVPTTFVVPVRIETVHNGRYGYRVRARIPPIANGAGIPLGGRLRVGRRWTLRGERHSYVNARCPDGHLQARGEFAFADGTRVKATFFRPCQVRR